MDPINELADAVVAAHNGGGFSQTFNAERRYLPEFTQKELATLRVIVVCREEDEERATRKQDFFDYSINVGVWKKIDMTTQVESDALMGLTREIRDFLRQNTLPNAPGATWLRCKRSFPYDRQSLEMKHVFAGVITVTYRTLR